MFLNGKVQTAQIGQFHTLDVVVTDKDVMKLGGGRPQYSCRIVRGWPGLEEVQQLKKAKQPDAVLQQAAMAIPLPQEDQVLPLVVLDITGKAGYKTLVCEVVQGV